MFENRLLRILSVSIGIALAATFLIVGVVASERAREVPGTDAEVRKDVVLDSFEEASEKVSEKVSFELAVPASTKGFVLADLRITGPKTGPIVISVFGDAEDPRRGINLLQSAAGLGKISGMENARTITVDGSTAEIADNGNGILQIYWVHNGTHYLLGSTGFSEDEVVNFANSLVRTAE